MDVRRQQAAGGAPEMPVVSHSNSHAGNRPLGGGMLNRILVVLLIIIALVTLGWFASKAYASATADSAIKGKAYQAVFLTNGQVYFGKVASVDNSYVKLADIYYLQVQQQVQPKDQNAQQQPQVSLAKLGGELHGPEDVMYISRQQVLFWENLKDDGKVTKAIKDYKASGQK